MMSAAITGVLRSFYILSRTGWGIGLTQYSVTE
jgi:hypothetical protein